VGAARLSELESTENGADRDEARQEISGESSVRGKKDGAMQLIRAIQKRHDELAGVLNRLLRTDVALDGRDGV
jgi:hypothetical protein